MDTARTMTPTEWALLAVLSVLWGGSFLFVAVAVAELPPLTLVLARVALAALALQLAAVITGQHRAIQGRWLAFAGMGPQQRHPVQPDLLESDQDHGRPGFGSQCHGPA